MKKIIEKIAVILLITALLVCTGCAGKFDAKGYVKAIMDASYKAEYTKYLELTNDTQSNAVDNYESIMDMKTEMFSEALGIQSYENSKVELCSLTKEIFSKTQYTIEDVKEENDEYIVTIGIKPVNIWPAIMEKSEVFIKEFNEKNQAGAFADYSEAQYYKEYVAGILDIFRNEVANITYGEEIHIDVKVQRDEDGSGLYMLKSEDYMKIDSGVFLYK